VTYVETVIHARAQSRSIEPLDGWDRFVEDHDMGDADPGERVLSTFLYDTAEAKRRNPPSRIP
jgi:hypothetical protein